MFMLISNCSSEGLDLGEFDVHYAVFAVLESVAQLLDSHIYCEEECTCLKLCLAWKQKNGILRRHLPLYVGFECIEQHYDFIISFGCHAVICGSGIHQGHFRNGLAFFFDQGGVGLSHDEHYDRVVHGFGCFQLLSLGHSIFLLERELLFL